MAEITAKKRKAREQAFIVLFEKSFNSDTPVEDIVRMGIELEVLEDDRMMLSLVTKTELLLEEIDKEIEANLKGWSKSRISRVSLALLRLAICEMKYFEDVPLGVSINEAVEICKIYGSDEDKSFINGVLGSVARSMG